MKLITLALFLTVSTSTFASQKSLVCAYIVGTAKRDSINKLPNTDKFKHCALSCQIGLRCSSTGTATLGFLKEIADLFGPGNSEWADIQANMKGIRYSRMDHVNSDYDCLQECSKDYD
jgi:hypothetical protein